ncbi:MAG: ABC transporter ATP-binding protein [Chitinivibrionia bacterium]|nr:ABC transporter ATP-binding protein [Chitinivibrionia bacterium]
MANSTISGTSQGKAIRTILSYLRRYRGGLAAGAVCLVMANLFLLASPWVLKTAIDSLKAGTGGRELLTLALIIVAVTAASGVFRFLMRRIIIGVSRKIEFDLRQDFFSHLETLSPSFYLKHRTGDLMALATNDLAAVRELAGPGVMYPMNTIVISCFAVSLMAVLSWKLTLVSLLPMILLSIAVYRSMKVIHMLFEKVQEKFAALNSRAQENLSGIRVVKAYAREDHETELFRELSSSYIEQNMKLFKVQSLLMPLLTFIAGLGALTLLAYGGMQVIDGALSLGSFVAFHGYLAMLIWPMVAIGWVMNITQRGLASMGRINAIMEQTADIRDPAPHEAKHPGDFSICFDRVSFTYPGSPDRPPALRGVSFTIGHGTTTAIVGPTGSGKTSIVSLIVRLFEPDSGRVLLGGVPVNEIPLAALRRAIGLVPQDIFLFSTTLRENMAFGAPALSDEALSRYSAVAAVRDEVEDFPRKYETIIGERGINLSGGQKQRVAIARALAKDPDVLILDDALSSVDTNTEETILIRLKDELKKRTSIVISHRVSTVQNADEILVLDGGTLAERGTHEELLARGGLYADMYRKQALAADLDKDR